MIRAVIFDCFGVLTSDGWSPFKKRYFSGDTEKAQQASDLSRRLNSGHMGYGDFVSEIAELADVPSEEASRAVEQNVTDEEMLTFIERELKPKYKIAMLSNAGTNMLADLFSEQQIAMFDEIALSFATGAMKPQERAYRHVAERLGVEPEECIFVDDQERYCTAAKDFGMQAIWYRDFAQFKSELENYSRQS